MTRIFTFWMACLVNVIALGTTALAQAASPHVVFVVGDHEYRSERTMPLLAEALEKQFGMKTTVLLAKRLDGTPDEKYEQNIPGLEALAKADLAVFYLRWRQLPADQVRRIEKYLESGKPLVGFRTTSHSFKYPTGHELEKWNAFGSWAFGTPPGWGADGHTHYGHSSSTDVSLIPAAANHPVLTGVATNFHARSWLYHVVPKWPPADATPLLMGRAVKPEGQREPVDNPVAWTWKTKQGARSFYTSLGHPEDFQIEGFERLVINAIHWALAKPIPPSVGKLEIRVPYEKEAKP